VEVNEEEFINGICCHVDDSAETAVWRCTTATRLNNSKYKQKTKQERFVEDEVELQEPSAEDKVFGAISGLAEQLHGMTT